MVRPRPVEQTFLSVLYCQTGMSDPPEETVGAGLKCEVVKTHTRILTICPYSEKLSQFPPAECYTSAQKVFFPMTPGDFSLLPN